MRPSGLSVLAVNVAGQVISFLCDLKRTHELECRAMRRWSSTVSDNRYLLVRTRKRAS